MARSDRQAQVLRNKRVVHRVIPAVTGSSVTPDLSINDHYHFTALATSLSIHPPKGNPRDGERLVFRIKDNGTPQTLTWAAIFRGSSIPNPTAAGKTHFLEFRYNEAETKWDLVIAQALS